MMVMMAVMPDSAFGITVQMESCSNAMDSSSRLQESSSSRHYHAAQMECPEHQDLTMLKESVWLRESSWLNHPTTMEDLDALLVQEFEHLDDLVPWGHEAKGRHQVRMIRLARELLWVGRKMQYVNDHLGSTALTFVLKADPACVSVHSRSDIILSLLNLGADPNMKESSGKAPIHYAVEMQDFPTIKMLVDYGADVSLRTSREGETALQIAAARMNKLEYASVAMYLKQLAMTRNLDESWSRLKAVFRSDTTTTSDIPH